MLESSKGASLCCWRNTGKEYGRRKTQVRRRRRVLSLSQSSSIYPCSTVLRPAPFYARLQRLATKFRNKKPKQCRPHSHIICSVDLVVSMIVINCVLVSRFSFSWSCSFTHVFRGWPCSRSKGLRDLGLSRSRIKPKKCLRLVDDWWVPTCKCMYLLGCSSCFHNGLNWHFFSGVNRQEIFIVLQIQFVWIPNWNLFKLSATLFPFQYMNICLDFWKWC